MSEFAASTRSLASAPVFSIRSESAKPAVPCFAATFTCACNWKRRHRWETTRKYHDHSVLCNLNPQRRNKLIIEGTFNASCTSTTDAFARSSGFLNPALYSALACTGVIIGMRSNGWRKGWTSCQHQRQPLQEVGSHANEHMSAKHDCFRCAAFKHKSAGKRRVRAGRGYEPKRRRRSMALVEQTS